MNRRALLAGLVAGASGCLGPTGGTTRRSTTTREATPTATASATPRSVPENRTSGSSETVTPPSSPFPRRVAVEAVDDAALRQAFDVAVDVSVPDGDVTEGDTALVAVALRTTAETARSLTYEQRHCGRNEFRDVAGESGLLLFPANGEWPAEDGGCPVVRYSLDCGIPVVEETVEVPATGELRWRYDVLVPPGNLRNGGCVVPGEYRFERRFAAGGSEATLSFGLSVTEP